MLKWKVNGTLSGLTSGCHHTDLLNHGDVANLHQHITYNNDVNGEGVYRIYNRKSVFDNFSDDTGSTMSSNVDDNVFDDLELCKARAHFQKVGHLCTAAWVTFFVSK